jgi:hypothetical protein
LKKQRALNPKANRFKLLIFMEQQTFTGIILKNVKSREFQAGRIAVAAEEFLQRSILSTSSKISDRRKWSLMKELLLRLKVQRLLWYE